MVALQNAHQPGGIDRTIDDEQVIFLQVQRGKQFRTNVERAILLDLEANRRAENIGARRLHTILEALLEELAFTAPERPEGKVVIDGETVKRTLQPILGDEDLASWGTPRASLWEPLADAGATPPKRVRNNYTLQRRILLALRKDIHERPHGKLVERIRYYCDVLLRDQL